VTAFLKVEEKPKGSGPKKVAHLRNNPLKASANEKVLEKGLSGKLASYQQAR